MRRGIGLAVFVLIGGVFVWSTTRPGSDLSVHSAAAYALGQDGLFVVAMTVDNAGPPEILTEITSPGAEFARLSALSGDAPIVIPTGNAGIFAYDGAHVLVFTDPAATFIPVTLGFESGARVTTRAEVADRIEMEHGVYTGVQESPAPDLSIAFETGVLTMQTEHFRLVRAEESAAHVPGEGHAHVYLNGLKLGRLYSESFAIGDLAPGQYTLRVTLSTHDHQPYLNAGDPVSAELTFTMP